MNWFLLLVILGMAGGGYYEYQTLNGQIAVDGIEISDLKAKLQTALDEKQKLSDEAKQVGIDLTSAQAKAANLAKQVEADRTAPAATQTANPALGATTNSGLSPDPGAATPGGPAFTTKLGNVTALDGKTYAACQVLKFNPDSIVISDSEGITQVPLNVLPPPVQKMFGFDLKAGSLTSDQVQLLEQKRQAAAAAGK